MVQQIVSTVMCIKIIFRAVNTWMAKLVEFCTRKNYLNLIHSKF